MESRSISQITTGLLLAALAAGASAQGAGWTRQAKIVLNTTASGADVAGEVKGYPVPVQLHPGNFDFAQARPDGADLRFTSASGAPLPYQIESWDAAAKRAAVWVKADVKGNDKAQHITMHWGNPGAASESDGARVFAKEDGWVGVWHLAETGSTAAGNYKDATANAAHGTGLNVQASTRAEGRVGPGVNLVNSRKEYLRIEGSQTNPIYNLTSKGTYSIWVNAKSHTVNYQAMFTKGETGFRIHYYGLSAWGTNQGKHITEPCVEISGGDFCPLKGGNANPWQGTDVKPGSWFLLTLVIDKPKVIYYVNAVHEVTWESNGNWTSGSEPVAIGNNADRARSFDGLMDEARILNVPKGADWVKLDFESQKEGSRFLEFESGPSGLSASQRGLAWAWPPVGALHRRYSLDGRLVAEIRTGVDRAADAAALLHASRPGLHVDRWVGPAGDVRERKLLVP